MNGAAFTCRRRCTTSNLGRSRPQSWRSSIRIRRFHQLPATGYTKLTTRRLISVSGDDATKFLQGLIAANLSRSAANGQSALYSVFLNAQGRVLYDVFINPGQGLGQEDELFIECDANGIESLYTHLKRYKLRAKVKLRIVDPEELSLWSSWGHQRSEQGNTWLDGRVPVQKGHQNMGARTISEGGQSPGLEGEEMSQKDYEMRRIMLGVAEGQQEIMKESALPQESNIDYMGGIDFRKGCYVGQELTIRTHHTGVVRKRILPVQLYPPGNEQPTSISYDPAMSLRVPPAGSNISRVDRKGRSAGKWLGGVGNVGLALCRLEVMTDTALTGEGSQWKPDEEFKVSWKEGEDASEEHDVRVKAFVPWWHAVRGQEQNVRHVEQSEE